MKLIVKAFIILISVFAFLPLFSVETSSHDILPAEIQQYVKDNPDATIEEIQAYIQEKSPGYTQIFKDKQEAINVIEARGSTYAFEGSEISKSFKKTIQSSSSGPGFIFVALGISFVLGALHALTPGHGKTMVAAYLIGTKGRMRDAVILGLIVTATHTSSVILLGVISLFASKYILPETLFPWLGFISGTLVTILGLKLAVSRFKNRNKTEKIIDANLIHSHGGTMHAHGSLMSNKTEQNQQSLDIAQEKKNSDNSFWNILSLGVSGGIVPCPDALVVLLIAISLGKILLGITTVLAFSIGLATVLILIGIFLVLFKPFAAKFTGSNHFLSKQMPFISSIFVTFVGLTIAFKALVSGGIIK